MKSSGSLGSFPGGSSSAVDSSILAHQGGWDEILLVVGPLAVVAGLLWLANRRVTAQLEAAEAAEAGSADDASGNDERS